MTATNMCSNLGGFSYSLLNTGGKHQATFCDFKDYIVIRIISELEFFIIIFKFIYFRKHCNYSNYLKKIIAACMISRVSITKMEELNFGLS